MDLRWCDSARRMCPRAKPLHAAQVANISGGCRTNGGRSDGVCRGRRVTRCGCFRATRLPVTLPRPCRSVAWRWPSPGEVSGHFRET
jgi:hypothetical protein